MIGLARYVASKAVNKAKPTTGAVLLPRMVHKPFKSPIGIARELVIRTAAIFNISDDEQCGKFVRLCNDLNTHARALKAVRMLCSLP